MGWFRTDRANSNGFVYSMGNRGGPRDDWGNENSVAGESSIRSATRAVGICFEKLVPRSSESCHRAVVTARQQPCALQLVPPISDWEELELVDS